MYDNVVESVGFAFFILGVIVHFMFILSNFKSSIFCQRIVKFLSFRFNYSNFPHINSDLSLDNLVKIITGPIRGVWLMESLVQSINNLIKIQ